ncbi:DNA-processing protein DprA [Dactylosporangium sp. CA-139114]|uniref:DNA-processing protein DprA n=1 Tax=Dactylosporangium sp. CA-139114 TaxID=3239931 RepID=UPI003D9679CE
MIIDENVRNVLAALSWFVGYAPPPDAAGVLQAHDLPVTAWAFPENQPFPIGDASSVGDLAAFGQALRDRAEQTGLHLLVRGDQGWPAGTGCDVLPCLWVRGDPQVARLVQRAVTLTGSSAPSEYGLFVAEQLTTGLAAAGWTAVTGVRLGADYAVTSALRTAAVVRPVLVSGAGLDGDLPYVYERIADTAARRGALISPFPPGCPPSDARSAVVASLLGTLTAATVVVEARRGDPVLACAAAAAASGRPVCAVPGHVGSMLSAGCHDLLAAGAAHLVTDAASVLAALTAPSPGRPAGFDSGELYRVSGTAGWDDGWWHAKTVPPFYVASDSHHNAADQAFQVLFTAPKPGATLTAGVYGPDGTYQAVEVSTTT